MNILDIRVPVMSTLGEEGFIQSIQVPTVKKKLIWTTLLWWGMKPKRTSIAFSKWTQKYRCARKPKFEVQCMEKGKSLQIKFSQNVGVGGGGGGVDSFIIPKASMKGTMVFCMCMPTTISFVKIF